MERKVLSPTKNKMNLTSKEISQILHLKRVRKNHYRRNLDPEKIIERIKASFRHIHAVM